ncbi:MAG: carotenoid biosynthesis protein [Candidatus Thorarchaeota archaeon]
MTSLNILPMSVAFIVFILAFIHAMFDGKDNLVQRVLMLATLFFYGILLEYIGITSGHHYYAVEPIMILGVVPLSIPLAWVGIIYSAMIIGERLELSLWNRILTTTLLALSLDWGMDPIAVELGLWTWTYEGGSFFGVPSYNFAGWFFIPVAYLIAYNFNWNKERNKLELLSISLMDKHVSLKRRLYTLFLVIPISLGFLILIGLITTIPIIYNLPFVIVVVWEVFTILYASWMVLRNRGKLYRRFWYDLIPSIIILYIGYFYAVLGFSIGQLMLGIFMCITPIPLLLVLIFNLLNGRKVIRK